MKGFLLSLGFFALVAGHPASDSRIVDGAAATKSIPYVVSIQENDVHICGGFIYDDKWVVTAASCVYGKGPATLKVSVNDYKFISSTDPKEKKVAVFKIVINEGYVKGSHANDIALIELAEGVGLVPQVDNVDGITGPSCINYDEALSTYTEGTVSGWGLSEAGGPISTTLKTAQVQLEGSPYCANVAEFTSGTMICTSNTDSEGAELTTALCNSDEGAPLVVMDTTPLVVGIYSFSGGDQCIPASPSVFTRLSVFYAWLTRNAGQQPDCVNGPFEL